MWTRKRVVARKGRRRSGAERRPPPAFLVKAPEDRKNRKVRHTDEYLNEEMRGWIREEVQEIMKEKAKKDKER